MFWSCILQPRVEWCDLLLCKFLAWFEVGNQVLCTIEQGEHDWTSKNMNFNVESILCRRLFCFDHICSLIYIMKGLNYMSLRFL